MAKKQQDLSSRQKAAIFMVSIDPEISARLYKELSEEEIEQLTLEIANLRKIPPELRERTLEEFGQLSMASHYLNQGGIDYARELLDRALGAQKASEILNRLTASLQVRPFDFARKADPQQLLNFIEGEHPQTIALILAYLHPDQSSTVISSLPGDRQVDVARRIALMDRTSPEIVKEVERVLERKLSSLMLEDSTSAGGIEAVVQILNNVDRATEKTIMEVLEVQDPELAEEIKKRMFVFEDLVFLDDRSIQRVLREIDMKNDLPLALKAASDEVRDRILKNMSKRAQENLHEDMEYLGPVRLRDVEDCQQRIVAVVRTLEDRGEVIIARGGGDEIIV